MSAFETAFAKARKAGKKVFSFNGKSYNTKLAKLTDKAPVPKSRSSAVSDMSKESSYSSLSDIAKNPKTDKNPETRGTPSPMAKPKEKRTVVGSGRISKDYPSGKSVSDFLPHKSVDKIRTPGKYKRPKIW